MIKKLRKHLQEHFFNMMGYGDTISHSTYYRYLNILRERKISFGYIHGVNMENGIKKLYRELKEGVR